jgi:hypothetical protein
VEARREIEIDKIRQEILNEWINISHHAKAIYQI